MAEEWHNLPVYVGNLLLVLNDKKRDIKQPHTNSLPQSIELDGTPLDVGAYSAVYRSIHPENAVVKIGSKHPSNLASHALFEHEYDLMTELKQKTSNEIAIPTPLGFFRHDIHEHGTIDVPVIVMEHVPGISINRTLADHAYCRHLDTLLHILHPILNNTLASMHSLGECHGDPKPTNFIIDFWQEDFGENPDDYETIIERVTTIDLGSAPSVQIKAGLGGEAPASLYVHPRVRSFHDYEPIHDIYTVTMFAYYMLTGNHPFNHVLKAGLPIYKNYQAYIPAADKGNYLPFKNEDPARQGVLRFDEVQFEALTQIFDEVFRFSNRAPKTARDLYDRFYQAYDAS